MKKILFLIISLIFYDHSFAYVTQGNWRWRKDDGSETSATWLADFNTQVSVTSYDPIRLRVIIGSTAYSRPNLLTDSLEYATSDNYAWKYINLSDTSNDF